MGKRYASFYRCLVFARFWEVKFWRSFINCQYFNDGWTDFHKNIYLHIFTLGFFPKTGKKSGFTPGQNDDPVTRTWKMTQMTHWPDDPVTQFHVWGLGPALCRHRPVYTATLFRLVYSINWLQFYHQNVVLWCSLTFLLLGLHIVLFSCTPAVWQSWLYEYVMLCYSQQSVDFDENKWQQQWLKWGELGGSAPLASTLPPPC